MTNTIIKELGSAIRKGNKSAVKNIMVAPNMLIKKVPLPTDKGYKWKKGTGLATLNKVISRKNGKQTNLS